MAKGPTKLPKHHYIPVLYLSQWADGNGRLYEFSRPNGRSEVSVRPTGPKGTGYDRGLYRLTGVPEVRTSRTNRIGLTDRQAHLFFRLARKNTYRSVDDVERILRFRVVMPRYRLGRTDLHLGDAETGPSSVIGATFNFIRPACGVWRLHVNSLQFCAICGGQ